MGRIYSLAEREELSDWYVDVIDVKTRQVLATGSVQHMSAELRVNGQVQRGCAYFGGARND
mgnify:CR=1 FL=1